MKNNITEIVFLLDRSGSMGGLEKDTIGGFNSLIEKQKKESGTCYVSVVLFDHETKVLYDRVPLEAVRPMTDEDYSVRGSTALIDALGGAIHHIGNIHKYARREDVPERTMFVITTDGMDNASHIYTSDKVKKMVEKKREKKGWEFLFIGANIDAVETAKSYGMDEKLAVGYHSDAIGTKALFASVGRAVACSRKNMKIAGDWCAEISADNASR